MPVVYAAQVERKRKQRWGRNFGRNQTDSTSSGLRPGGCLTPPSHNPTGGRRNSDITAGSAGTPPAQLEFNRKRTEVDGKTHTFTVMRSQLGSSALICAFNKGVFGHTGVAKSHIHLHCLHSVSALFVPFFLNLNLFVSTEQFRKRFITHVLQAIHKSTEASRPI